MNDREILAATLRWHTAHMTRMEATTASNKFKSDSKKRTGFGGADRDLSARVTAAKRVELAALRDLAKVCAKVRGHQKHVDDANEVMDVEVKLLTC
ncbi:MAG: hypothetical protein PHQ58_21920 [Rhodoferax sp.]|uniref:hypothetical protein n=1 Tax=Rhodoferax sp. TaxID=50421 RepID=UPI002622ACD1|nr:hypothetical protein [Rhodoferax sp.]MDD2883079.1 hypothetical protein [Rhodoferax sp.]